MVVALAIGSAGILAANPAHAAEAPDKVSDAAVAEALAEARSKYGNGDKAELEALKEVAPFAVSYCNSYINITPGGGAWYKIPTSGSNINCVLESGVTGTGVRQLQETLNKCYGRSLVLDGSFGPATYNALMYAQGQAGVAVDGVYGTNTRKALKWWGGGSICTKGSSIGL